MIALFLTRHTGTVYAAVKVNCLVNCVMTACNEHSLLPHVSWRMPKSTHHTTAKGVPHVSQALAVLTSSGAHERRPNPDLS